MPCAEAQTASPPPAPAVSSTTTVLPVPVAASPGLTTPLPIVPGSLSGAGQQLPARTASPPPAPTRSVAPPTPAASPAASPLPNTTPPGRFNLHRPGTDIDGDSLTGNVGSNVYVFRGNVVLHSDPKVDRNFGSATESDAPLTVSADELDVDRFAMTYVAKGHVHFSQGTRSGSADLAMLNEQTRDLDLLGHADVLDGDHRARAAKLHYNGSDRQFHGAGDVRIYEPVPSPQPRASATPAGKHRRRLPF